MTDTSPSADPDRDVTPAYCRECGRPDTSYDGEYCSEKCANGERITDNPL